MSNKPVISNDPMYQLLREGKVKEFNIKKQAGEYCNLKACDFRSIDLRGIDAVGLDFRGCYFRMSDLRGVDFRGSLLDGCSINGAKISGTYFPLEITAQEVLLSFEHGTRLRVPRVKKEAE
ncbi:pentapeptide repeat-containing protein [sulfur-oxidizing endosymbiont of Gigantopelta aegis]|uniref:pentapeptide repeat-containing protein n=1 Tax=sulfur-oxidizing endosymbiont of Gigantopelta aegis TaxID=2794934 RepID=UPI0018DE105C|nr:pentapeptide repeat-containing protein [sulfur-oxidizing endosymbiont of Gigantopelta aegis]